jgi:hypothetical protein
VWAVCQCSTVLLHYRHTKPQEGGVKLSGRSSLTLHLTPCCLPWSTNPPIVCGLVSVRCFSTWPYWSLPPLCPRAVKVWRYSMLSQVWNLPCWNYSRVAVFISPLCFGYYKEVSKSNVTPQCRQLYSHFDVYVTRGWCTSGLHVVAINI